MKLDILMKELNDDGMYRFHLAKKEPGGTRPIDALAKSEDEWLRWQIYRGHSKERFTKDFIVSFAQVYGSKFIFGGVFEILDRSKKHYDVAYLNDYKELIGRLVINYSGENTRATVFKPSYIFSNTEISGINEHRFKGEPFVSFSEINHDFRAIEIIVNNELNDWKAALSSVFGVYLITDKATGRHYVGSACGKDGIWGRWKNYINSYHANNKYLVDLFEKKNSEYFKKNFKFAILEIMSSSKTKEDVIYMENIWKEKLFSREYGHNRN